MNCWDIRAGSSVESQEFGAEEAKGFRVQTNELTVVIMGCQALDLCMKTQREVQMSAVVLVTVNGPSGMELERGHMGRELQSDDSEAMFGVALTEHKGELRLGRKDSSEHAHVHGRHSHGCVTRRWESQGNPSPHFPASHSAR